MLGAKPEAVAAVRGDDERGGEEPDRRQRLEARRVAVGRGNVGLHRAQAYAPESLATRSRIARARSAMPINIPTTLTWLRIVLIPVFVGVYYLPDAWLAPAGKNWLAMGIFAFAAITDWLDGWLARRLGPHERVRRVPRPGRGQADGGRRADPARRARTRRRVPRDHHHRPRDRDLGVARMDGRARARARAWRSRSPASSRRWRQMTAIIALLLYEPLIPGVSTPLLGTIALWIAVILTLWSMVHYLRKAAPYLTTDRK
jgi:phosphatidylglycerophosphate synthase